MLDKQKCIYYIKTAQFSELLKLLEKEYIEIFDNFLSSKIDRGSLKEYTFAEKAKLIIKEKKESETLILFVVETFLNDEESVVDRVNDLIDMYSDVLQILS